MTLAHIEQKPTNLGLQSAVSKHVNRELMLWMYLIHEFHNLSWITEITELFHDILIYWDAPVDTVLYFLG